MIRFKTIYRPNVDLCEFKASLIYIANSPEQPGIQRPVSKTNLECM